MRLTLRIHVARRVPRILFARSCVIVGVFFRELL